MKSVMEQNLVIKVTTMDDNDQVTGRCSFEFVNPPDDQAAGEILSQMILVLQERGKAN